MASDPHVLGNPLIKTQHFIGAFKWEKVSDSEVVGWHQMRVPHQRFTDESRITITKVKVKKGAKKDAKREAKKGFKKESAIWDSRKTAPSFKSSASKAGTQNVPNPPMTEPDSMFKIGFLSDVYKERPVGAGGIEKM